MYWALEYIVPFLATLTILVFVHEMGHFWAARRYGVRVLVFSIGFGPEIFGWTDRRQTRWRISLIPLGGYVKMFGDSDPSSGRSDKTFSLLNEEEKRQTLHGKTAWQRVVVASAGPLANYLFAILVLTLVISFKGLLYFPPIIGTVNADMPAARAGLQQGDRISKIGGTFVQRFEDIRSEVSAYVGKELSVVIERNGKTFEKTIPMYVIDPETHKNKPLERLGIGPGVPQYEPMSPALALGASIDLCWRFSVGVLKGITQIISHRQTGEIGGILAIGDMASKSARDGIVSILWFMAMLSVNLGFINLIPIPILDGGHIVIATIEGIRGKPISRKALDYVFLSGFVLVLTLMVYATWSDLKRYHVVEIIQKFFKCSNSASPS